MTQDNPQKGSNFDSPSKVAIESNLPLAAVDIESEKDQSSGGTHPLLSIHKWFAARPTPAVRLAIIASVYPGEIDSDELLKLMQIGPRELDSNISEFVQRKYTEPRNGSSLEDHYGYSNIVKSQPSGTQLRNFHDKLKQGWGGELPTVLDPTAGRGIIPFEAVRYGLPAKANELNPVAALIVKTGLEYAPNIGSIESDLREWRDKIHNTAKNEIQNYYKTEEEGREILNSAYTYEIRCDSCGGDIPLVSNWWLDMNGSEGDAIKPIYSDGEVEYEHIEIQKDTDFDPGDAPLTRGSAECPHCGVVTETPDIREKISQGEFDYRIYGVNYRNPRGEWEFRGGKRIDQKSIEKAANRINSDFDLIGFLSEPVEHGYNTAQIKRYGMNEWRDVFTPRQLITHYEYLQAFESYKQEIKDEYQPETAEAILTILALCSSRVVEFNSRLSKWRIRRGTGSRIFSDNNLAIKLTAVDNNISEERRGYMKRSEQVIDTYEELVSLLAEGDNNGTAEVSTRDAASLTEEWGEECVDAAIIDPPYYSSIQYSELSDIFYVVLKEYLYDVHTDLFSSQLAEKDKEAVANPSRFEELDTEKTSEELAKEDYENKMQNIFSETYDLLSDGGVVTVMFTHREMDAWDTLTTAFINAGFTVTASHPIKTERADRVGLQGKASADSSILLIGRKYENEEKEGGTTLWGEIKEEFQEVAKREAEEILSSEYTISKTDMAISVYGPTLEKFAENHPVVDKKGANVRPRKALVEARKAVTSVIVERFLNTKGVHSLDSLTRWYILAWLTYESDEFPYDEGRQLGVAAGIDIDDIKRSTKIWSGGSKIKLKQHNDRVQDIVMLQDDGVDNPSSRKYPVNPTDNTFTYTIDAVHAALHVYDREGAKTTWNWLTERNLKSNEPFKIAVTALLEVLPDDTGMYETLVNLVSGETGEYLNLNLEHIDMSNADRQTSLGDHT